MQKKASSKSSTVVTTNDEVKKAVENEPVVEKDMKAVVKAEKTDKVDKVEKVTKIEKVEKTEIFVQYAGQEFKTNDIVVRAKQAYVDDGHKVTDVKTMQIYIKPEENAAYYVVNGQSEGKKIKLA